MQKDFHYYMTYLAARAAGLSTGRSRRIAEWAEVIDEAFNGSVKDGAPIVGGNAGDDGTQWVAAPWVPSAEVLMAGKVHRTVTSTKVTRLGMSVKLGSVGRDAIPWIAFHFLPGIREVPDARGRLVTNPYKFDIANRLQLLERWHSHAWGKGSDSASQIEELRRVYNDDGTPSRGSSPGRPNGVLNFGQTPWDRLQSLICWPNSQTANAMIQDTQAFARHLVGGGSVEAYIRSAGVEGDEARGLDRALGELGLGGLTTDGFMEALLGVRMHVYVDTWAHQGFMGANIPATNATDRVLGAHNGVAKPQYQVALHTKMDAKRMRDTVNLGHAQIDSFADHPALDFQWTRVWDGKVFRRNNPREFAAAYRAMHDVFVGAGRRLGWTRDQERVAAWSPDRIDERFFRSLIPPHVTGDFGAEKRWRCEQIFAHIRAHDGKTLLPFDSVNPDFGIIRHVFVHRRVDLGYFSLAALYHQRWVEKQIANGLGYSHFGTQVEEIARRSGSAGESIRKALAELAFADAAWR